MAMYLASETSGDPMGSPEAGVALRLVPMDVREPNFGSTHGLAIGCGLASKRHLTMGEATSFS